MVSKPKKADVDGAGEKNRGGRKPMRAKDRRSALVRVLTTKEEHEALKKAAGYAQLTLSTWVRRISLERARALIAEKEADR